MRLKERAWHEFLSLAYSLPWLHHKNITLLFAYVISSTNTPHSCISGVCNRQTIQTFIPERVNTYNTSKQKSKFCSYKKTNYNLCIIASPGTAHKWDIQRRGSQSEVQTLCKWQYQGSYVQQEPLATWKLSKTANLMKQRCESSELLELCCQTNKTGKVWPSFPVSLQ